jgi:hypothetical protein
VEPEPEDAAAEDAAHAGLGVYLKYLGDKPNVAVIWRVELQSSDGRRLGRAVGGGQDCPLQMTPVRIQPQPSYCCPNGCLRASVQKRHLSFGA